MCIRTLVTLIFAAALLTPAAATAQLWYPKEFSADITLANPNNPQDKAQGKIYIGKQRFRTEGKHLGVHKAVIVDAQAKKAMTLYPGKKEYHDGYGQAPSPPRPDRQPLPSTSKKLCQQQNGPQCKLLGTEQLNGYKTNKWEITLPKGRQGNGMKMTLWTAPERQIIIKQQAENGPTMERKLLGVENIQGRPTEKWEVTTRFKDKSKRLIKWIDQELLVPIRVEDSKRPGFELTNIQVGPQSSQLFTLPKDYRKVAPPARPLGAPQQGQRSQQQGGGQQPNR
ncbi:MAG: hypothetical protein HQL52_09830 [Magnetococcales bacterium]|nr:hypothetical protein [Magnetococcales bacterium]